MHTIPDVEVDRKRANVSQSPRRLRLGLIGLGDRGRWHLKASLMSPNVTLVGAFDPGLDQPPPDLPPHLLFDTLDQFLRDADPEVVIMSVPHDQYLPLLRLCSQRKISVLQEKPPGRNLSETRLIVEAQTSEFRVAVAAQRRHSRAFDIIMQKVAEFGPPLSFNYSYHVALAQVRGAWRLSEASAGGGALMDMGYHVIDMLTAIMGPPNHVSACAFSSEFEEVESAANLLLSYPSSASGVVSVGWFFRPRDERATFWWRDFALVYCNDGDLLLHSEFGTTQVAHAETRVELLSRQLEDFLASLHGHEGRTCSIAEAMHTMEVLERCQQAIGKNCDASK